MGGVLWYKLEGHCITNWRYIAAFPLLQSLEASKALRYKLAVYCQYLLDKLSRWGFLNSAHFSQFCTCTFKHNFKAVRPFAAANFAIFFFFSEEKGQNRDVATLPHLSSLPVSQNDPKVAWDCSPNSQALLQKIILGVQSQAFFLVHLGFNITIVGLFGPQNGLNHRNVEHAKLYLSKKG